MNTVPYEGESSKEPMAEDDLFVTSSPLRQGSIGKKSGILVDYVNFFRITSDKTVIPSIIVLFVSFQFLLCKVVLFPFDENHWAVGVSAQIANYHRTPIAHLFIRVDCLSTREARRKLMSSKKVRPYRSC